MDIPIPNVAAAQAGAQHRGIHRAGENRVDAYLIGGELNRHGARQRQQPTLASCVGGDVRRGLNRMHRGDVNHRTTAPRFE